MIGYLFSKDTHTRALHIELNFHMCMFVLRKMHRKHFSNVDICYICDYCMCACVYNTVCVGVWHMGPVQDQFRSYSQWPVTSTKWNLTLKM